jgi:hypothetical protein
MMRTTLTLDDDVAVEIERLRQSRNASLKELINELLRGGLREINQPPRKRKPFRTQATNMGKPLISLDNVAEVISYLEGDWHK